ncbi:MAG: M23 family metallopeptidase [Mariprofundales bacterium]
MKQCWWGGWAMVWLLLSATTACSTQWQATQGDIVRLHHAGAESVLLFGQQWPLRVDSRGGKQAWIGVDLAKKPGDYAVVWQDASGRVVDHLTVRKGDFRRSHITVKRAMAVFDAKQLKMIRRDQKALRDSYRQQVNMHSDFHFIAEPIAGIVSTPLGARRIVNGEPRSPHSGIDIAAPAGTKVHLPAAGVVLLTAAMYLNGNSVVVGHGDGLVEIFSHLRTIAVRQGDHLAAGATIGEVGATGRATGPHLHWGVRFAGARVSPKALLAAGGAL